MKIIIYLFLIISFLTLNSCFLAITGAPHNHFYENVNKSENNLNLSVFCAPLWKTYRVSGVNFEDKVYIKSTVLKNPNEFYLFENKNENTQGFDLKIGDMKFHKRFNDTIILKIIDSHKITTIQKFIPKKNLNE